MVDTGVGAAGTAPPAAPRTAVPRRWRKVAAAAVVYLIITAGRFVDTYAGTPEEAKDCDPVEGRPVADDQTPEDALPSRGALPTAITQRGGTINDASCLSRTTVFGVARPDSLGQLRELLAFAASEALQVTASGARHSMGGQAFTPKGLAVDMRDFDDLSVDEDHQTLTAGSGATWQQVLAYLHPRGLSVASMQGVDVLTVGGSVSVNAHGTDHRSGSIASTVRSLDVMLADGRLVHADRRQNKELFRAVIGGYGLFGVIVSVELELVPNDVYEFDQRMITVDEFPTIYETQLAPDDDLALAYVHLSTAPKGFMDEAILYTYSLAPTYDEEPPPLREIGWTRTTRFMLNSSKTGRVGQWAKWAAQKHVLPRFRPCIEQRSDAMAAAEACFISRNQALYTSLDALRNKIPDDTDILQEYFLPRDRTVAFIEEARDVLRDRGLVLVNASIRVVHADDIMLSYAPTDRFAVVLYVNQKTTTSGDEAMADATRRLIDAATVRGGTFYLPYQLRYTQDQLEAAYPAIQDFFALKRRYDPDERFSNHLYERYGPPSGAREEPDSAPPVTRAAGARARATVHSTMPVAQ